MYGLVERNDQMLGRYLDSVINRANGWVIVVYLGFLILCIHLWNTGHYGKWRKDFDTPR
jgi:succinate dehydrogenase hydrophobic anchor subunit